MNSYQVLNSQDFGERSATEESEDSSHYETESKVKVWRNVSAGSSAINASNVSKPPTTTTSVKKTFQVSAAAKYPFKASTAATSANVRKDKSTHGPF